jgi:predicted GNAT family N-acyltransferase
LYAEYSIGRIVIQEEFRRKSLGRQLFQYTIAFLEKELGADSIRIAALKYLEDFYKSFNFKSIREYSEWDYAYVEMLRN